MRTEIDHPSNDAFRPALSRAVGVAGVAVICLASLWLMWSGHTDIRYSADHAATVPIWHRWIPALIGLLLIRFLPLRPAALHPIGRMPGDQLLLQTWILLAAAALYAAALILVRGTEAFQVWYLAAKLGLLLIVPLILWLRFSPGSRPELAPDLLPPSHSFWRWTGPIIVVCVWSYLHYFSPWLTQAETNDSARPAEMLAVLLAGFLINSLLEELFYRKWLQTRLELFLGRWPAIFVASILWAIWHIAIQGTGRWDVDAATMIANHGVIGLFLGYLWPKYRNAWTIVAVHGFLIAPPLLLLDLFGTLLRP